MRVKNVVVIVMALVVMVIVGCRAETGLMGGELEAEVAGAFGKLVEFVEDVSPIVWETAVRQAYVQGVFNTVWGILLIASSYFFYKLSGIFRRKHFEGLASNKNTSHWERTYDGDYDAAKWMCLCGCVTAVIVGLLVLTNGLSILANPNYSAIKEILSIV